MKRMLPFAILMLSVFFSVSAFAEEVDITNLGDKELIELRDRIEVELSSRGSIGGIIREGTYVVGTEIASGIYDVFNFPVEADDAIDVDMHDADGEPMEGFYLEGEESVHITLQDGDTLEVLYGRAILIPFTMIGSK